MSYSPQNRFTSIRQLHTHLDADSSSQKPPIPKRGRPATGKRSNPNWVGRTYYIRRQTDQDIQTELFLLNHQGVDIDKSQLVDALLAAWASARQSGHPHILMETTLNTQPPH